MTTPRRKTYEELRSARWYGAKDLRSFGHRSRTKQMGFTSEDYAGKPVIAILNTWSEMNPCHFHFRERAAEVKRGIWQAGGFPVEMPAISLGEPFMKPSTMLYRNLLAMEAEELLRANPDRRRGAAGRLRQDRAGPHHGRPQHEPAGDLRAGGADAARQLARPAARHPAATPGNTGPSSAPATSTRRTGARSRTASRAPSAPA